MDKICVYGWNAEAICTGSLAGHNAARSCVGMYLLQLPTNLVIGDFIAYSNNKMHKPDGDKLRFTFAGSIYLNRMKELDFYTIDKAVISDRVKKASLEGIYNKQIIK